MEELTSEPDLERMAKAFEAACYDYIRAHMYVTFNPDNEPIVHFEFVAHGSDPPTLEGTYPRTISETWLAWYGDKVRQALSESTSAEPLSFTAHVPDELDLEYKKWI